ncbi:MAG: FHA domain-containing protein [bacterium]|nr:FHA domain-containing protein [bacterium]
MLILQSRIGDETVIGNAFIIKSGDPCLALTSYEAVKGASSIKALVPGQGLVTVHLSKYSQGTNLALLEIPAAGLPAIKIGDHEIARPNTPVNLICAAPIMDGIDVSASTTLVRPGTVLNTITRPDGVILRVQFKPGIDDITSGSPIILPSTGEAIAVSLSLEISQSEMLRFAVPAQYVYALCPELSNGSNIPGFVKVKDGSEAPVLKGSKPKEIGGHGVLSYVIVIGGALLIVGFIAYKTRARKEKVAPFSKLPILPEGMDMAFVTADGTILPSDAEIIKIGRAPAPENTWVFQDSTVSNMHARIRKNRNTKQYEVEDLRSTNGTFVGKRRIVSAETITPGTIIRFGKTQEVMLMLRTQSENPMAQLGIKKR